MAKADLRSPIGIRVGEVLQSRPGFKSFLQLAKTINVNDKVLRDLTSGRHDVKVATFWKYVILLQLTPEELKFIFAAPRTEEEMVYIETKQGTGGDLTEHRKERPGLKPKKQPFA